LSIEEVIEAAVERAVRKAVGEIRRDAPTALYALSKLPPLTDLSLSALKRLRADGYLVGDGEGKLARFTVEAVREALRKKADATGPRGKALAALKKRRAA
jgi:hypothetical protein